MKSPEHIEKLIRNAEIGSNPDVNQSVLENLLKEFDVTDKQQKAPVAPTKQRRILMKSPMTKVAAAAVIIIAITLGLFQFIGNGSGSGVVWAEVAEQVQASPGFTCRSITTLTNTGGNPNQMDMRMYGSPTYGIRVDSYQDGEVFISSYGNRADNTIVTITHPAKTYTRDPLLEEDIANLEQMSPSKLVQQYLSTDYKELGSDTIDGIEAEGIEVNDPSVIDATFPIDSIVARLWVSKATGFPIRMEANISGNNGALKMEGVLNEFQWNVDFGASDFTPDIPSDYTLIETP